MVVEADGGLCWGILKTRSHCFVLGNPEVDHQQSNVSCRSLPTAGTSLERLQERKEKKKRKGTKGQGWISFFLSFFSFPLSQLLPGVRLEGKGRGIRRY